MASRFLTAVADGENISEAEIETMRNVLGIAYLGMSAPSSVLTHVDLLLSGGADTVRLFCRIVCLTDSNSGDCCYSFQLRLGDGDAPGSPKESP